MGGLSVPSSLGIQIISPGKVSSEYDEEGAGNKTLFSSIFYIFEITVRIVLKFEIVKVSLGKIENFIPWMA